MVIKDKGGKILPGMSAEVNLLLSSIDEETGYSIPFNEAAPGDKETTSSIFVFDPKTATVKKT